MILMNKNVVAILSITVAAIMATSLVAEGLLPTTFMVAQSTPLSGTYDSGKVLGHVTYIVRDANGNIKQYAQTDNTRTVQGINCAEQILFNGLSGGPLNTNGTNVCGIFVITGSAKFNGFNVIGLINGSSSTLVLNGSDTYTGSTNSTCGCGHIQGTRASAQDGIIRAGLTNQGSPQAGTVAGTSTYNQITITSPSYAFSNIKTTTTIRGSVLLNGTGTVQNVNLPSMFAENALSSAVSVGTSDTLTVTWTITLT